MNNWMIKVGVGLVLTALVVTPVVAFVMQNLERTSELSLNLGFQQWELVSPLPVPALMGISLGVGLLVGVTWGAMRSMRLNRELRAARRDLAMNAPVGGAGGSGW